MSGEQFIDKSSNTSEQLPPDDVETATVSTSHPPKKSEPWSGKPTSQETETPPSSSNWGFITDEEDIVTSAPPEPRRRVSTSSQETHTVVSSLKSYGDSIKPPPARPQDMLLAPSTGRELLNNTILDGRYRIRKVLGGGGMGAVYEGEQIHNGKMIAVKVLPFRMMENVESRKRFFREAKLTASLTDANVCRIYDFGTLDDGRPYYVMELLNGKSLADRLEEEGHLALLDAIEIMMQVLSGLRAAHRAGIVHRDVKPANIFLHKRADQHIQVKLLDFGVAKRMSSLLEPGGGDETTQLTKTGFVMGTPFYLSPEQLMGERALDLRVDIWSTGVVLYEILAGKRPFTGKNFPELMEQIMEHPPAPLIEVRPDTPLMLQRIINRALAKDRDERFKSAGDFLHALQAVRIPMLTEPKDSTEF